MICREEREVDGRRSLRDHHAFRKSRGRLQKCFVLIGNHLLVARQPWRVTRLDSRSFLFLSPCRFELTSIDVAAIHATTPKMAIAATGSRALGSCIRFLRGRSEDELTTESQRAQRRKDNRKRLRHSPISISSRLCALCDSVVILRRFSSSRNLMVAPNHQVPKSFAISSFTRLANPAGSFSLDPSAMTACS